MPAGFPIMPLPVFLTLSVRDGVLIFFFVENALVGARYHGEGVHGRQRQTKTTGHHRRLWAGMRVMSGVLVVSFARVPGPCRIIPAGFAAPTAPTRFFPGLRCLTLPWRVFVWVHGLA